MIKASFFFLDHPCICFSLPKASSIRSNTSKYASWTGSRSAYANQKANSSCVNWKEVWQAAVITGAGGFLAGAIFGTTVGGVFTLGTLALPAGVSAAMVGLAVGFTTGASYELLRQLIFKCLLRSTGVITAPPGYRTCALLSCCEVCGMISKSIEYSDVKLWYNIE